jgi:UPF0176 protein
VSANYQILLYYLYAPITDPEAYVSAHQELCESLGLRGRILIAAEGLNGTVSGTLEGTQAYIEALRADPVTAATEFKIDPAEGHVFPRLSIKLREEVVTLGLEDDFSPVEVTGAYLEPPQWREMMAEDNVVLVDARNDYEWELGHFEGAMLPKVNSFRELPRWVEEHREELEGKKIMTYCTGGIRCEKFSGYLRKLGFEDVYQLHGGIVTYGKDPAVKGDKFAGSCYVFDERIGVEINSTEGAQLVSSCLYCNKPSDRYANCAWMRCNRQHFCCEECAATGPRYCESSCREAAIVSIAAEDNDEMPKHRRRKAPLGDKSPIPNGLTRKAPARRSHPE